ncbi:MAG: ATP-binding cassette domain-containing protein [Deltaproteobacteria bacterium]|nr:ATP-binding cassette domain-containing protein [Deltaproteobacteria bacterium]
MESALKKAPIIKTVNVVKTYRVSAGAFKGKRPLHAVNGVSITLPRGSVLGLVGESGCGKSTMAKMILKLEDITSGEIFLDGRSISSLPSHEIARKVQPIFQDPYSSLNPRKNIASIITLPLRALKVGNPSDWKKQVDEIMEVVGLPPRLKYNYPSQLSGGQRQRVAVARALIMRPEVVICDEPTSALDVSVQSQILNLLMDLQKELGLTYILISHNLAVVEHLASRVAVMYLGRIVEEAETQTLFQHPRHPYTQALLASVLTPEPRLGLPETHLGITYPNPIDPPPGCTFHPRCPKADKRCSRQAPQPVNEEDHLVECFYPGAG